MNRTALTFICIFLILLSTSVAAASDENIIFLKSGNIDTDNPPEQNASGQDQIGISSTSEFVHSSETYYIVQFDGHVTQQWKDEVQDAGAEFFDYIPNNAFVLRMNGTEKSLVESLDFVRWTGELKPEYKLSSGLNEYENQASLASIDTNANLIVVLFDPEDNTRITKEIEAIGGNIISRSQTILRIEISESRIDQLAAINGICWVENYSEPVLFNDVAAGIMNVNTVNNDLGLNGSEQIVAVCDTGLDTGVNDDSMHADIRGRILEIIDYSDDGAEDNAGHGTHVVGSILGNGTMASGQYKGMAPEASLVFQAVQKDMDSTDTMSAIPANLNQLFQDAYDESARIHSDSWGYIGNMGEYNSYSQQVDQFMWEHPDMLIIFAAGNEGPGEKTITSPATAKNCIAVGASENERTGVTDIIGGYSYDSYTDNINEIASFSSRGPTDDIRIKPDLVAPGTCIASTRSSLATYEYINILTNTNYAYLSGTSMATPLVAGSAALVREYYTEIEKLDSPSAALLKATLINGAYDITQEISGRPDYSQGWGRVDVENSILVPYPEVIAYFDYIPLSDSGSWDQTYEYVESGQPLRATLVWTDYPASELTGKTLVNDLDLTITDSSGTYYGNNGHDHINNVEGIELNTATEGDYTITVEGHEIQEGPQPFALVFSFTCDNNEFPANGSYADSSTTEVSTDVVHPGGVNQSSIKMEIDGNLVDYTAVSITDGYRIQHNTSNPYQNGEHNVTITALTDTGQQFSYGWEFSVKPEIPSFKFTDPAVDGIINEDTNTIDLTVPYGTDVTALTPTIDHTGTSVSPDSGVEQDFTNSVTYTVTAADSTTQEYVVTVTVAKNPAKSITCFDFDALAVVGTVDENAKTVALTVPYGTDVTSLTPTIVHTGISVSPDSGTAKDFTNPVTYTVTAADSTTQEYVVTVTVAKNPAKSITSFEVEALALVGTVDEEAKTVALTVPYGTDVTSLTPTIAHTGASVSPDSGTAKDFTNPVTYTVTAADSTTQEYVVTVTVALNPAKEITSFEVEALSVVGIIDENAKTVGLTVPYGTDVTALTPTIDYTGASVSPDSGVAKDFTNSVTYTVTAEDASTQQYTVTVNVAPNTAKEITSFEFTDSAVTGIINLTTKTVTITVPYGTDRTALVPTIGHTGEKIEPDTGIAKDFTNPVTYTVTAADSTTQEYEVTVNVAPNTAKEITSFKFTDPAVDGIINETAKTVNITVPYGTNVTALIPTIVHTGDAVSPNTGIAQNFTNPINYTVTAIDTTTQKYVVTVKIESNSNIAAASTSTTSSGGGGGGGGGGTTGETYENIAFKDVLSEFVSKGSTTSYEFDNEQNAIEYIRFKAFRNWGKISSTIEMLHDRSALVDMDAPDTVYCNVNLWVGKSGFSSSENIEDSIVGFRIQKDWIEENEIDVNTIRLCRYSDGQWNYLDTQKISEDGTYLHFEASTPGFSPFAITGKANETTFESTTDAQYSTKGDTTPELNTSIVNETQAENTVNAPSILISGLIISFVCFLIRKQ